MITTRFRSLSGTTHASPCTGNQPLLFGQVLFTTLLFFATLLPATATEATTLAVYPIIDRSGGDDLDLTELYDSIVAGLPAGYTLKSRRFVEQILLELGLHVGDDPDALDFERVAERLQADYVLLVRLYPVDGRDGETQRFLEHAWKYAPAPARPLPYLATHPFPPGGRGPGYPIRRPLGPMPQPPSMHPSDCNCQLCDRRPRHPDDPSYVGVDYTVTRESRTLRTRLGIALVRVRDFTEVGSEYLRPDATVYLEYADYDGDPAELVDHLSCAKKLLGLCVDFDAIPLDTDVFHASRTFDDYEIRMALIDEAAAGVGNWVSRVLR